jgi:PPM family protein phosphatase
MASVLRRFKDPGEASAELVRLAREHGGADNITVVVVDVVDDGGQAGKASRQLEGDAPGLLTQRQRDAELRRLVTQEGAEHDDDWDHVDEAAPASTFEIPERTRRRFTPKAAAFLVAVILVLAGAYGAVWWYANNQWYVGLDGETVAIYRGQPGGLLWFEPELVERTEYRAGDLRPSRRDDLERGKVEPSRAEARRYVARLAEESGADSPLQPGSTLPPSSTTTAPTIVP